MFLLGLQKLGKGDWKGISRNYVTSRTPSQVASHAQKYFNRQTNSNKRKRRSSVFDIISENVPYVNLHDDRTKTAEPSSELPTEETADIRGTVTRPDLKDDHSPEMADNCSDIQSEFLHSAMAYLPADFKDLDGNTPSMRRGFFVPVDSFPIVAWERLPPQASERFSDSKIVRPTPVLPTTPISLDIWNGISQFSLSALPQTMRPSPLSLKLNKDSSRNSAFHSNQLFHSKEIDSNGGSFISVV